MGRILGKWIVNARVNFILDQDRVAVRLNEKIDPFSSHWSCSSRETETLLPILLLILNVANSRQRVQEQRSKPMWLPRMKEEPENVATHILVMRIACNFH